MQKTGEGLLKDWEKYRSIPINKQKLPLRMPDSKGKTG